MGETEEVSNTGKWEDEEERRFYEELAELKDFVPISILNVDGAATGSKSGKAASDTNDLRGREASRKEHEDSEIRRLENEMENIKLEAAEDDAKLLDKDKDEQDAEYARLFFVFVNSSYLHLRESPPSAVIPDASHDPSAIVTAPGPSALLTTLLARLPDATNRSMIDQLAVDFAFLNSKAARKRLIKV